MSNVCRVCGATPAGPLLGGVCPRCVGRNALGADAPGDSTFGGHELIRELGRGGAGIVYLARQITLDRLVALKVLAAGAQAGPSADERFLREAREAARLNHPHIVAIHEVGRHHGQPFYSMDFIEGDDLSVYASGQKPGLRTVARLAATAARAVHYAHEQGVLHRDLKPRNLIVDAAGEPHLVDFGLATALDGSDGLTRTGEVMGSPGYIAPEQLRGESSVATDVYGLGGVLYFLLTGRAPFVAAQLPELLAAVAAGDPLPPRRLDPSLPRDLETITLRALAADPAKRYPTAAALADDLERWLTGQPITARPISPVERAWRWAQRNRKLSLVTAALTAAVLLGALGVVTQWRRAEAAAADRQSNLYSADLQVASNALLSGDLGTARRVLAGCPEARRDAAWGLLWPQTAGDAEAEIGHSSWTVTHLAVSPDGTRLAATAQVDRVRLWDLTQSRALGELPGTETSWWTAFSPDGRELFTADHTVKQWDVASRKLLREFPGMSGAISPDGKTLYTCQGHRFIYEGAAGVVTAWEIPTGKMLFEIPGPARTIALSHDGTTLAVSDAESTIALYDARDGRRLRDAWPSQDRLWHLTFSPDDRLLVASGWSTVVRLWDLGDLSAAPRRLLHPLNTWETAFSPDGRELAVACSDRTVHVWDTATWKERRTLRGHDHEAWSLAWQPDGKLLSAGRDPRVLRWPTGAAHAEAGLRHDPHSFRIVWLPGGRLATVREPPGESFVTEIASSDGSSGAVRFPDEMPLAADPGSGRLWLWRNPDELRARKIDALDQVAILKWPQAAGESLVGVPHVEPRAGLMWAALANGSLDIRHLGDGVMVRHEADIFHHLSIIAAALSPDGRWFVWGGVSTELHILDIATGQRTSLEGHHYEVASVEFAPDGKTFVTGGTDGLLFVWETAAPHRRQELGRHMTSVGQMAFSPDGRVLATHEGGLGIHLWHPATGREVGFLSVPDDGSGQWLGFSPEGDRLALRLSDGRIRVFPVADKAGGLR
jgi:WD40 repeat protein